MYIFGLFTAACSNDRNTGVFTSQRITSHVIPIADGSGINTRILMHVGGV